MLGDLFNYGEWTVRVAGLPIIGENIQVQRCDTKSYFELTPEQLKPIPLTEDHLSQIPVAVGINIGGGNIWLKHLHQLQHMLKLIGLDIEITNCKRIDI